MTKYLQKKPANSTRNNRTIRSVNNPMMMQTDDIFSAPGTRGKIYKEDFMPISTEHMS
jgi:hypothetical protein